MSKIYLKSHKIDINFETIQLYLLTSFIAAALPFRPVFRIRHASHNWLWTRFDWTCPNIIVDDIVAELYWRVCPPTKSIQSITAMKNIWKVITNTITSIIFFFLLKWQNRGASENVIDCADNVWCPAQTACLLYVDPLSVYSPTKQFL